MCAKSSKKKKRQRQTLSYPLAIRSEDNARILRTLQYLQKITNKYLHRFYQKETLELLCDSGKKAYKVLEGYQTRAGRKTRIPSRVNRGVLEITGRTLRTTGNRKNLFELLVNTFGENPVTWKYNKLIKQKNIYIKSHYIQNLGEQTENFFEEFGTYPNDFFELQHCPKLKKAMVSFAPDDGQAVRPE